MNIVSDAIAGAGLLLSGYIGKRKLTRTRRRDAKEETKTEVGDEVAKVKELAELKSDLKLLANDMKWVREQLGRNPNGGGSMEQLLKFVNIATTEFAEIKAWNLRHMELHVENKKG